jgi:hypothetical protein
MKALVVIFVAILLVPAVTCAQDYTADITQLFREVQADEMGKAEKTARRLADIPEDNLKKHLDTESKAKSFWINAYNTFTQYLLKKDKSLYDDRSDFFSEELITIAGHKLSLDDIEHGIIRRSKNKYSMGYVGKLSVGDFEKKFRLEKVDYRIHFALNCGAKSCPPVALYVPGRIDEQLDKSSTAYLKANTKFDKKADEVSVPKLCSWFKADFGGEDGVIDMLHKYKIIGEDQNPDVDYLDYDWTLSLSNYIEL